MEYLHQVLLSVIDFLKIPIISGVSIFWVIVSFAVLYIVMRFF